MARMWVPPTVAPDLVDVRRQHISEVHAQIKHVADTLERFNAELRRIDSRLMMVRADPGATAAGLKPGYYHVLRDNEGAPPTILPIEGPDGEFVEPGSHVFDMLARGDLWNPENMKRIASRRRQAEEAAEKLRISEREARQDELRERVNAATRAQVSMNTSTPWTQNNSSASRRDAASRRKGPKAA